MKLLALLLLALLPGALAIRASHRAPVIFAMTTRDTNRTDVRGTSIRTDGEYRYGLVDDAVMQRVQLVFPLATVLVVNTDDELANAERIGEWMRRECFVMQRRVKDDCFVLSGIE